MATSRHRVRPADASGGKVRRRTAARRSPAGKPACGRSSLRVAGRKVAANMTLPDTSVRRRAPRSREWQGEDQSPPAGAGQRQRGDRAVEADRRGGVPGGEARGRGNCASRWATGGRGRSITAVVRKIASSPTSATARRRAKRHRRSTARASTAATSATPITTHVLPNSAARPVHGIEGLGGPLLCRPSRHRCARPPGRSG
jgi:hypothetical protein